MNTQEIQTRIEQVKRNIYNNETKLDALQTRHRKLSAEHGQDNLPMLHSLNQQAEDVQKEIETCKNELSKLDKNLATAQVEEVKAKEVALQQQKEIAHDIEKHSKKLIELLGKTVEVNKQLLPALNVYCTLLQKTGQNVIGSHCQGSRGWLKTLYEICQSEMQGRPRPGNLPPLPI